MSFLRQHTRLSHSITTLKMSTATWNRLIRFVDDSGKETFGEPIIESEKDLEQRLASNDLYATELKGPSPFSSLTKGDKIKVKSLSNILRSSDVPIIRCIGLNYTKHSKSCETTCGVDEWLNKLRSQGRWSNATAISFRLHQALNKCSRVF